MKIALYSDLHLEFMRDAPWQPPALDADVVILAGDIDRHTRGIEWSRGAFPYSRILYVAGNHEFYGGSLLDLAQLREAATCANIDFLENDCVVIDGVRFLGAVLWSSFTLYGEGEHQALAMRSAKNSINDYHIIRGSDGKPLEPRETARLHSKTVAFLTSELAKPFDGKTVVVTHFSPHGGTIHPAHEGNPLTPYFATDLSWLIAQNKIDLWAFGHSHTNNDFIAEGGCRILSNQRGYAREAANGKGFREDLIIDLNHSNPVTHTEKKLEHSDRPDEKVFVACFEHIVKAVDRRFDVRNCILATLATDCLDHNNVLSNPVREKYRECVQDGVFDLIESCARNFHRMSPEN